jgi:hypothetical protein
VTDAAQPPDAARSAGPAGVPPWAPPPSPYLPPPVGAQQPAPTPTSPTAAAAPPPPLEDPARDTGEPGGFDRLSLAIAILLAMLGVLGAFATWRIGQLGSDSEQAGRDALAARREHSASDVEAATEVVRAASQWLGYEIAHRKAEALRKDGQYAEAVRWDREAAAYWGGVPNAEIALDGTYDPTAHAAALTAAQTDGKDVFAEPHLDTATAADFKASRLGQIGFWLAAFLPVLTMAEITSRRRVSVFLTLLGAAGIASGAVMVILAWA